MAITQVSNSLVKQDLTIVGGTVDNTVIGSGTPAAGTFTTVAGSLASTVTGTTAAASDNSTKIATTAYVTTAIANLVDTAPSALNTLNELAAALGDDANFATTVNNSIAAKAALAGATFTGSVQTTGLNTRFISNSTSSGDYIRIYAGSGTGKWDIYGNGANLRIGDNDSAGLVAFDTGATFGGSVSFTGSGNTALSINTGNNSGDNSQIKFGDSADDDVGQINYDHGTNAMQFRTNAAANTLILDNGGKVGIKTSPINSALYVGYGGGFGGQFLVEGGSGSAYVGIGHGTDHPALHWKTGDFRFATSTDTDLSGFSEKMRISNGGNVGIGVTPSASHYETLELGTVGSGITGRGAADTHFLSGLYWDGASTRKYAVSGVAVGTYQITNGAHYWSSPAAGTAGNTATVSANMTLDASGNVGLGVTATGTQYGGTYRLLQIGNGAGYGIFNGLSSATAANTGIVSFFGQTSGTSGYTPVGGMQVALDADSSANAEGRLSFYTATGGNLYEHMRIAANGNVLIGTTANQTWNSAVFDGRLRIGARGVLATTTASTQLGHNFYYDGAYKYIGADFATRYYSNNGEHVWLTAPSGSAGGTITFSSARMVINNAGQVGIGTASPYKKLTISAAIGGTKADLLDLQSSTGGGGTQPMIRFGTMAGNANTMARIGVIDIPNYGGGFVVETNSTGGATDSTTEKFRIDHLGNVIIGLSFANASVSDKTSNTGTLQINQPGRDNIGGHIFMTQDAAQNTWKTICQVHDVGATGMTFLMNATRQADQNRHCTRLVRYAYNQTFTEITVSQQNTAIEYRVSGTNLQYRFTTGGPYSVSLMIMADG